MLMVLMSDDDWNNIHYMHYKNNDWGDYTKIHRELVFNIENMRRIVDKPFILTCPAYAQSGHSPTSTHGLGKALDGKFLNSTLLEMYIWAERFNFSGIGLYPNNGNPFIHLDTRDYNPLDNQSRWIAIGDPNNWTYIALNEENIRKYVI